MKHTLIVAVYTFLLMISAVSVAGLERKQTLEYSAKEDYELREQCRRSAETVCKSEYGPVRGFCENYYNRRLNRCFVFIRDSGFAGNTERLMDVNEKRQQGAATAWFDGDFSCSVRDKPCKDRQEWDAFVKQMMEE